MHVAEYLGQRTDVIQPIQPVTGNTSLCPFNGVSCRKIASSNRKAPVCSLRQRNQEVYIVCEERLISTKIRQVTTYQRQKLLEVAQIIFNPNVLPEEIAIKSEVSVQIPGRQGSLKADFIMKLISDNVTTPGPRGVIMEIQGGGETSNTGTMQRHVETWESQGGSNSQLASNLNRVGAIQTNAWRRLQEQMFVKGAIAKETGYGFVACIGPLLHKLVNFKFQNVKNLRNQAWEVALITFIEDTSQPINSGPIPLRIDHNKVIFTSFDEIAIAIANQGISLPSLFQGTFTNLRGDIVIVP